MYLSSIPASRKVCFRHRSFSRPSPSEVTIELLYCWTPSESILDVAKPDACVFTVGKVIHLPRETASNQIQIGDVVCGVMASGRVSRSVSMQVSNTFVKPTILTQEQATYIPACLAIAFHALQQIGTMGEKKKLLIHQAHRGPGPVAVALAKALGHEVFCTISDTCQSVTESTLLELGAKSVAHQSLTRIPLTLLMQFCFSTHPLRTLCKKAVDVLNAEEKSLSWEPNLMVPSCSLQRKTSCM